MGCYWEIKGTVKPMKGKKDDVADVLRNFECDFSNGIEEGTFDLYLADDSGYGFADDLAEALEPILSEGKIDAENYDDEAYFRYEFSYGRYTYYYGKKFIYYNGFTDDFVDQLPDEVIQAVIKKYAKATDKVLAN